MSSFSLQNHPLVFDPVQRLEKPLSWAAHIPFAMLLIDILRPPVLVELGVHTGNSYFAFCQAVRRTKAPTHCHGVDTWQGDGHAGLYGDEIYQDVASYNERFATFSTLHRGFFDDVAATFPEGSIDVLHIDGLHTYEAVAHDYETWAPRLNPARGVVLFHDTQVREHDFGVWRFWREISQGRPAYEFKHGSGLGILGIGKDIPIEFLDFLKKAEASPFLEDFFASRGAEIVSRNLLAREYQPRPERYAKLYLDTGLGFNERQFLYKSIDGKRMAFSWSLPRDVPVKGLRFDPLNDLCVLRLCQVVLNGVSQPLESCYGLQTNLLKREGDILFFGSKDPQIILSLPEGNREEIQNVSIEAEYLLEGGEAFDSIIAVYNSLVCDSHAKLHEKDEETERVKIQLAEAKKEIERSVTRLDEEKCHCLSTRQVLAMELVRRKYYLPNPRFWKSWPIVQPLRPVKKKLDALRQKALEQRLKHLVRTGWMRVRRLWHEVFEGSLRHRLRTLEGSGAFSIGWHGCVPLPREQEPSSADLERYLHLYEEDTWKILTSFPDLEDDRRFVHRYRAMLPLDELAGWLGSVTVPGEIAPSFQAPSFAVLTPFFRHVGFFEACAVSVEQAFAAYSGESSWIIVNDDPSVAGQTLLEAVPAGLRPRVRLLSDGRNLGPAVRLNEAALAAEAEWLIFLDCDDELVETALSRLAQAIAQTPSCRYISSTMLDIDTQGAVLRHRLRRESPCRLFVDGMTAGHLKAVRRDLFDELGGLDPSTDCCQDYDFALRAAAREPLLYLPEALYRYRWHGRTQSVSRAMEQDENTVRVLRRHALSYFEPRLPAACPPVEVSPTTDFTALLRTQAGRLDMLDEALRSLHIQDPPVRGLVTVHDDAAAFEAVAGFCRERGFRAEVIHAPDTSRLRGYPLNVALEWLRRQEARPDFVFMLDDDDIVYPNFTSRMLETLRCSRGDFVYAASNKRLPWQPAEAAYTPLPSSCLIAANFIPTNSYCLRYESLAKAEAVFDESMNYLEDWSFLLHLLRAGLRFVPLADTLSEFRIVSDGNTVQRKDPAAFAACQERLGVWAADCCSVLGRDFLYAELLRFPVAMWPHDEPTRKILARTLELINRHCPRVCL